jgi:predicted 3-demethylubiquinone-9 3-methyltransferase (glyoxalase superfamily)
MLKYLRIPESSARQNILAESPSNKPNRKRINCRFELDGQHFVAMNGGSFFKINEAIIYDLLQRSDRNGFIL